MDVGAELIRRMNMDNIIDSQADADDLIGGINPDIFAGTAMGEALKKPAISGASMTSANQHDSLLQQQAYVISKLTSHAETPALLAMVMAWPGIGDKQTVDSYNATLPDSGLEIDIGKSRFVKEIQKMGPQFFQEVTSGQQFDPEAMGWKKLPDGWQSGTDKPSKVEVVHDYLARNAAKLGTVGGASARPLSAG